MPIFPSVFPFWWIGLTALIATSIGIIVLRWRYPALPMRESTVVALIVGCSVLVWRLSGNIPPLNNDPVAGFSPNDWLCPVVTYVCLGVYAGLHPPADRSRWIQVRALLTIGAFAANVLFI
jgi:peptidoglycan/LPS O-acetylase OafA/YrhL